MSEETWTPRVTDIFGKALPPEVSGNVTAVLVLISDKGLHSQLLFDITLDQYNQVAAQVEEHSLDTNNKIALRLGFLYEM